MPHRGPKPGAWITGPDPLVHAQYQCYIRSRAQAQWRGEQWSIDFDTWRCTWGADWPRRGRASDDLCMTRRDVRAAWSGANVQLVTRAEHCSRWSAHKAQQRSLRRAERALGTT